MVKPTGPKPDLLKITFERIGRQHTVEPLLVSADLTADEIAYKVHRYSRHFLASNDCVVTVDLADMTVEIEGGRFGRGTITREAAK